MLSVAHGMPQFFNKRRTFPGQRLRGATNYGTHSFSERGYVGRPFASKCLYFRGKFSSVHLNAVFQPGVRETTAGIDACMDILDGGGRSTLQMMGKTP
ncbi:hypothetical protein O3P69_000776 [Scylla paramamosain]|uniref:Uncharacterized protein n=1 Tax=Scylla paramamosain TaxID=85552 RepID=A0AAW0UTY3_SCYPA